MNTVSWSITDIFEYVIKYHNNTFTYSISSLTSSLQFVPPVVRTGLETQWVSPQERSRGLSTINSTMFAIANSSEKSLRDFVDLSSINQLELTKSIIERLRSGVETLKPSGESTQKIDGVACNNATT